MNSTKVPFTLSQKVYIVKTYYKQETIRNVVACMQKRFNIKLKETDTRVISQLVLEFEASGSVLRNFCYTKDVPSFPGGGGGVGGNVVKQVGLPDSFWMNGMKDEVEEEVEEEEEAEYELVETTTAEEEEEEVVQEEYVVVDEHTVEELEEIVIEAAESSTPYLPPGASAMAKPGTKKSSRYDWKHCAICDKWFPNEKYTDHVSEVHLKDKHTCKECGKVYLQYKSLLQHLKTHGKTKPQETLICEICGRISSSKKTQKAHLLVHSEEKNHVCPDCGMRFVRLEGLRRHRRTHTGEKPYKCDHCGATFAAYMSHQMHVRLHTGERPFKCHHCNESFIGGPALNNHLKIHAGEYMHECYICFGRFKTQKTMEEHIQKKHTNSSSEVIVIVKEGDDE